MMDHEEIVRLTEEYGGGWGINHSLRLLHLVSIIGEGLEYNHEAVWLAAYLHDWGGYAAWLVPGVEHQVRSREVVEGFLREHDFPSDLTRLVLECVECHHGGPADRSIESILLADADALDLLGAVGVTRIFAMCPRDLKAGFAAAKRWREKEAGIILLEKTRELAAPRIKEMDELLAKFEEETYGYL